MEKISIKRILKNNIMLSKELRSFDKSRLFMTSLYWLSDNLEIIAINIFLLPFLYYAIDNSMNIKSFLIIDGALIALMLLCDCYMAYYKTWYVEKSDHIITQASNIKVFSHIKENDLGKMYDPEFIDMVNRLLNMGTQMLSAAFDMQWWGVSSVIMMLCYITVLIRIDLLLIIIAIMTAVIMYFVNLKINIFNYKNNMIKQDIEREKQYITDRFALARFALDQKTSNLREVLKKKLYQNTRKTYDRINKIEGKIRKYSVLKNVIIFFVTTSLTWLYLGLNYLYTDTFKLSVTEIIVAETMMQQLCDLLVSFSTIGPSLMENSLYAEDYFGFFNTKPLIEAKSGTKTPARQSNGLSFKDIYFSYNEGDFVLKGISLDIKPGEKVAIVGENGAGKSTLVKLLLRLYEPQSGSIAMDGEEINDYELESYRSRFGIAFQNIQMYSASVAENIMMSPCDPKDEKIKDKVDSILERLDLRERIYNEKNGISTVLTKEFDEEGLELSGGQSQKLAIARVLAGDNGIIVLDEPSAALDPISETELYQEMIQAAEDKTMLMISHRLGICRYMDRIYVMKNGSIAEQGTHDELITQNGIYTKMWNAQASGYIDD
jgi:ATP-binding cassette subfamily B protein